VERVWQPAPVDSPTPGSDPTSYLVIAGRGVLVGKQPDGDSVRFRPDEPALLTQLADSQRIKTSADATVQLRFDGVDAPELHYEGVGQPDGVDARDRLLSHLGFTDVTYTTGGETVATASPVTVPVVICSRMVEVNGRPVAVLFTGEAAQDLAASSGDWITLDADRLATSVNTWQAQTGSVYPLLYTSTPAALREVFTSAAAEARTAGAGVWASDATTGFPLTSPDALGPGGALIWPKLFRRATDYFHHHSPGQSLPDWLAATPEEDDSLYVGDSTTPTALHTLLRQDGAHVSLTADLLDLVIIER